MSTTTDSPDVTMQVTNPPTNDVDDVNDVDDAEHDESQQVLDGDQGTHDAENEVILNIVTTTSFYLIRFYLLST